MKSASNDDTDFLFDTDTRKWEKKQSNMWEQNENSFQETNGTFDMQFKFPLTVKIYWNLICVECVSYLYSSDICFAAALRN